MKREKMGKGVVKNIQFRRKNEHYLLFYRAHGTYKIYLKNRQYNRQT
jgi:hypothetical protein